MPTTIKKVSRPKSQTLSKLILTGSLMAQAQREVAYPSKSLGGTWEELLEKCHEEGVFNE